MNFNLKSLYRKGLKNERQKRQDEEIKLGKVGALRAGNSAVLTDGGDVIGSCHRLALLRKNGVDTEFGLSTLLMFQAGLGNEAVWYETLVNSGEFSSVKREQDVPTAWSTTNGTLVTGRPDIVCFKDEVPVLGIELKEMCSIYTMRDTIINGNPKANHLAQALHYMWQLNIPYKLAYASRVNFPAIGKFFENMMPKQGEAGSEHLSFDVTKGHLKNTLPALRVYDLNIDAEGKLSFRDENSTGPWTQTLLSVGGLKNFYEAVSTMEADNTLGPRPSEINWDGQKAKFSPCKYCDFSSACDKYEGTNDVGTWLNACREIAEDGNK